MDVSFSAFRFMCTYSVTRKADMQTKWQPSSQTLPTVSPQQSCDNSSVLSCGCHFITESPAHQTITKKLCTSANSQRLDWELTEVVSPSFRASTRFPQSDWSRLKNLKETRRHILLVHTPVSHSRYNFPFADIFTTFHGSIKFQPVLSHSLNKRSRNVSTLRNKKQWRDFFTEFTNVLQLVCWPMKK